MIEKIYFDVENPTNSSVVYSGFREQILKKFGVPEARTAKLEYSNILDNYLDREEDNEVEKKRTVLDDYMSNTDDYEYVPIWLQNTVIGFHFKKSMDNKKDDIKVRNITTNGISSIDKPIIANLTYGNFKHDPNPQVFVMYYDTKHGLFEGFNLRYLNANTLKKIIQLSIKFPNIDMYYFYHGIIKPFSIGKALKKTMKDIRRTSKETLEKQYKEVTKENNLVRYGKYPSEAKERMKAGLSKTKTIQGHDTADKTELKGYNVADNLLMAYRKYKKGYCHFYNVPTELF